MTGAKLARAASESDAAERLPVLMPDHPRDDPLVEKLHWLRALVRDLVAVRDETIVNK